jgi:hypothetical protein
LSNSVGNGFEQFSTVRRDNHDGKMPLAEVVNPRSAEARCPAHNFRIDGNQIGRFDVSHIFSSFDPSGSKYIGWAV